MPDDAPAPAGLAVRVEIAGWALLARAVVAAVGVNRALRLLDTLPRRRRPASSGPAPDIAVPHTTCLHRSLGRSQYLRRRGLGHDIVIGVAGTAAAFRAHAWVDPPDPRPGDFVEIHRYRR